MLCRMETVWPEFMFKIVIRPTFQNGKNVKYEILMAVAMNVKFRYLIIFYEYRHNF